MKQKTRVFFDAMPLSTARTSGVGNNLQGLLSSLTRNSEFLSRYEIVLVTTIRGMRFLKLYEFQNVSYRKLPIPSRVMNRLPTLRVLPPLDLLLGRGVYVFTNFLRWPMVSSPTITTVHDLGFMVFPENLTNRHRRHMEANVSRWAKSSTVVVAVSKHSKGELMKYLDLPSSQIEVVPNGVDASVFEPKSDQERAAVRRKYALPEHYILFVGNIEPRKNLVRLIAAYRRLPATITGKYPLVLVGGSSWLDEPVQYQIDLAKSEGLSVIRPTEFIPNADLPAVISAATLLVHPAMYEGFGLTPLEAMACGTPVIAGNNSSLPEVIGEAGVLVEVTNVDAITAAIERVLGDKKLYASLVAAGHKQVPKYSLDMAAAKLIAIIDRLALPSTRTKKAGV